MVPHIWIKECLDMFGIANNTKLFLSNSMNQWKTDLTCNGDSLGIVNIRKGIFQGDSLSSLVFVISLIPLSKILHKVNRDTILEVEKEP